ncbi:hypothetical protein SDC9_134207 [bioreactor metagenome]|uniref:Uncharacterized protein n=1 Tax=bioreactor metagenome TaxID=1076179 RepID=A0A645DCJ5_9ZZZZ
MMELKGQLQLGFQPAAAVFAPDEKGIVEDAAVKVRHTVQIVMDQSRGADDHAIWQLVVLAAFPAALRQLRIGTGEFVQLAAKRNVAGAQFTTLVFDNHIDAQTIVLHQLLAHGQQMEFRNALRGAGNAPAHEHVEGIALFCELYEVRHIHRFEDGDHGHGRVDVIFVAHGAVGGFWVNFSHFVFSVRCFNNVFSITPCVMVGNKGRGAGVPGCCNRFRKA